MSKDDIIFVQFIALIITVLLYITALNDSKEAERYAQQFYQMLPEAKQQQLRNRRARNCLVTRPSLIVTEQ